MFDVIIVGGGPAGLTSAIYVARNNLKTILFEGENFGGQVAFTPVLENYPGLKSVSGTDFSKILVDQAKSFGAEIKHETLLSLSKEEDGSFLLKSKRGEYRSHAVIIASGCKPRPIGCENEEKFRGRGVSYCAHCDGFFFKDKDVAIVGAGNAAFENALFLSSICKKVYLLHRSQKFRADKENIENLKKQKNVVFVLDSVVKSINGKNVVESISVENILTKELSEIAVSGVFGAVGQIPSEDISVGLIELDEQGYALVDDKCKTKVAGLFVAGDLRQKILRQIVTATADGAMAAVSASEYVLSK